MREEENYSIAEEINKVYNDLNHEEIKKKNIKKEKNIKRIKKIISDKVKSISKKETEIICARLEKETSETKKKVIYNLKRFSKKEVENIFLPFIPITKI